MPRISVISGAYNISKCYSFEKSIESILAQSFGDFEFIICDDGSSDNTYQLLSTYAKKDNRIKLIQNKENLGLAASLNRCIEMATGEFIARHDLDDYNDETRFEKQLSYMNTHPGIDILGTACFLFDEGGVWGEEYFPLEVKKRDFLFTSPYKHGSVMMRKKALLKAGCYRIAKETYRTEDYDLFMTMAVLGSGANLEEKLYFFCEDSNTLARRKYKYRIDEAKVRWLGFKKLKLLPMGILYVIKPLIVGLIPTKLLSKIKGKIRRNSIKKN